MSNVLTLTGQTRDTLYMGTINSRSCSVLAAHYDGSHVMSFSQSVSQLRQIMQGEFNFFLFFFKTVSSSGWIQSEKGLLIHSRDK